MKYCKQCDTDKPLSEFNKNISKHDGLENCCRPCRRSHMRSYYTKTSKRRIQLTSESKARRKSTVIEKIVDYLVAHPCVDCGESDIIVLDFDHLRDKLYDVSAMVARAMKWESILVEIEKCVVRCANCHRRKTAHEMKWAKLAVLVER